MLQHLPYCGSAPVPGELLTRFNLDPLLLAALTVLAVWHVTAVQTHAPPRTRLCGPQPLRQVLMNVLRSAPVKPLDFASALHCFIFCCCEFNFGSAAG
jgi:putative membrane protein